MAGSSGLKWGNRFGGFKPINLVALFLDGDTGRMTPPGVFYTALGEEPVLGLLGHHPRDRNSDNE